MGSIQLSYNRDPHLTLVPIWCVSSSLIDSGENPLWFTLKIFRMPLGRWVHGGSSSSTQQNHWNNTHAFITKVENMAREVSNIYHIDISPSLRGHVDGFMEEAWWYWNQNMSPIMSYGKNMWHLLSKEPCTRYTRYWRDVEGHWITRLFVAYLMRHKDDGNAILLVEMEELKETMDKIKESMLHFGWIFGMCLFPIIIYEQGTSTPSLMPGTNVDAVAGKLSQS